MRTRMEVKEVSFGRRECPLHLTKGSFGPVLSISNQNCICIFVNVQSLCFCKCLICVCASLL